MLRRTAGELDSLGAFPPSWGDVAVPSPSCALDGSEPGCVVVSGTLPWPYGSSAMPGSFIPGGGCSPPVFRSMTMPSVMFACGIKGWGLDSWWTRVGAATVSEIDRREKS
jgi:hypothetical protein